MKVIDFQNASCKHCYKCVRNCSVKAISVRHEQAHIMNDHCIHCGKCLEVCPQNAKRFASDLELIKAYIRQNMKIVVSIAPSYLGVMNYRTPGQVVGALRKLGFDEVRETSEGAALVTREYQKLLREGTYKNIITTCCPSVNELVEKYYPELTDQLAPVVSPMIAHGRLIKKMYGEQTKVVFLGPCIAKKQEAMGDSRVFGAVDAILTFEELEQWLEEEQIVLEECEDLPMANPDCGVNRLYPVSGGVLQSVMLDSSEMREKEQGEEKKTIPQSVCRWTGQLYGNAGKFEKRRIGALFYRSECLRWWLCQRTGIWKMECVVYQGKSGDGAESGCPSEGTI